MKTIITIGLIFTLVLSLGIVADTAQAEETKIPGNETVRVIDYKFSTSDIPEGSTAKLRITIQNTGATATSGTLDITSTPIDGATVDIKDSDKAYTIEAGSRKSYIYEIEAEESGLNVGDRDEVELNLTLEGETVSPWESIYVLPKGSTVSEGTVQPTGEREQINKAFSSFKDNRDSGSGSYTEGIPPVSEQGGEFTDTSQGRIFNFLSAANDDSEYASVETYIDGNINVGAHVKNIPNTEYYTIQANYHFTTSNLDQVEFNVVNENGREIDPDTKYILSGDQRQTRYFQLSEKEIQEVKQSNNVYIVIENTNVNSNQEKLDLYYLQLISSDQPLVTESPDIKVTETRVFDGDGNEVTSDPSFETGETINVRYTVENHGNSVGERQVALYEDGEMIDSKLVEVNPGETKYANFSFKRDQSGIYRYQNPDPDNSNDIHVYVEGDEDLPPIAAISEPSVGSSYYNGRLIDDPTDSGTEVALSAENSFSPSGNIVEYQWDADWLDNTITTTDPVVTLPGATTQGTYNVVLTVVDNNGREDMAQEQLYAGTISPDPVPLGETSVNVNETVALDAGNSDHPDPYRCIVEYRWEDSDGNVLASNSDGSAGTTCTDPTETNTYAFSEAGTHTVNLIAVDDLGNEGIASRQINVIAPDPTAQLDVDKNEALLSDTFTFDASNSTDEEGDIAEYQWEMGDGTTYNTTSPTLSHSYTEAGSYIAKVTVVNEFGGEDTATVNVNALDQPFNIGIGGDTEQKQTGDLFQLDNTPTEGRNNVDKWTWTMGDGTTIEDNTVVQHKYDSPGQYTVTLTGETDDFGGFTDSASVTLTVMQAPPVADIDASYNSGESIYVSDAITFDGSNSYDPEGGELDYYWEVGNSNQTFTSEVVDSYNFTEDNLVEQETTLTVTDPEGLSDTETHNITIEARPPQASFTYTPQHPGPEEPTTFDASTSKHNEPLGEIVEYRWNFHYKGDGTDYTGQNIEATFPENNKEYEVTLTVEDQWGQTDSTTKTIKTDAYKSCHEFLQERPETQSGFYQLDPLETNNTIEVYCDMETDGGGWTVIDKESFYEFYQQVGNDLTRDGDVRSWNVSRDEIYSYDGGGDHSFRYYIDTGFKFTQVRTDELTFGSASYKANHHDTSEVRGDNTAIGDKDGGWDELNSGGVSGEIAIGTKYSIIDSWARERADIRGGDTSYWNSSWQWNGQGISGGDGNLVANPGSFGTMSNYNISHYPKNVGGAPFDRFHFENETYNKSGKTIGVGWGESGGQWEGWEWKTGSFMLRQPVTKPDYFYNQGDNPANFAENSQLETGSGDVKFESDHISLETINKDGNRYVTSDPIDLSKYKTIYIGYVLTVENGGSGYVEMEAGGKTVRDTIDQQYLVNDNSMSIDVSDVVTTAPITIQSHTSNEDTTTKVRVDRVWGQKLGSQNTTTEISGSQYLTTTSGGADFHYAYNSADFDEMFSSGVTNNGYWNQPIHWDHNGEINAPEDEFAWKYEGWIYAPESGSYTFGIDGDDGVDAYVKGQQVASWYGGHGEDGYYHMGNSIHLEKGWHPLKVRQEEGGGSENVDFGWNTPSSGTTRVPTENIAGDPQQVSTSEVPSISSGGGTLETYSSDLDSGTDFVATHSSINYTGSYIQYDGGFDSLSAVNTNVTVDPDPGYHVQYDTYLGGSWSHHSRLYLYDGNGDLITYGGVYHDDYRGWGGGMQIYDGSNQHNWTYQGIPHYTWVTVDYYYDPVNDYCEVTANGVTHTTNCSGQEPPQVQEIKWAGWQHNSGTSIDNITVEGWSAN